MVVISTPEVTPVMRIASRINSCCKSSKSFTISISEYDTRTFSSKRALTVTWMWRASAREVTSPPFGSESENQSTSVPPPQNETRTGVREIIIERGVGTSDFKPTDSG